MFSYIPFPTARPGINPSEERSASFSVSTAASINTPSASERLYTCAVCALRLHEPAANTRDGDRKYDYCSTTCLNLHLAHARSQAIMKAFGFDQPKVEPKKDEKGKA